MLRSLSGIQPTNNITLGNYLGALKNWVTLQDQMEGFFPIVDLHALSVFKTPEQVRHSTLTTIAAYIASGIDPKKNSIFIQSHVPYHTELAWILNCYTPLGWLNRMTQFKEKAGKKRDNANLALYAYPVLQAADILLYQATHVPVGEDQRQHIELVRDIAGTFNQKYEKDIFVLPEPHIQGMGTRVMSLRDGTKKMSKTDPSDYSRINLIDDADTIALKIRKAKTDPEPLPGTKDELETRPEALNLVTIYSALAEIPLDQTCQTFEGKSFSDFKQQLADLLIEKITPIGTRLNQLLEDQAELKRIYEEGARKANATAEKTLRTVKETIGLVA